MHNYIRKVAGNILPLSIAGDLAEAFKEWHFNGNTIDHETAIETCELCGQENLRYHFEIVNEVTSSQLSVGSECILKFEVAIYEDGRAVSKNDAKKHLDTKIRAMRLESCLRALKNLANAEENAILSNALKYYQRNKKLTPKYANVVFWRLQANNIDHDPSFFKISLNKQQWIADLKNMRTMRVHRFWSALTSAQKKKAIELGHRPPK